MRIRIRKSLNDVGAFVCVHRSFAGESFFSTRSKIVHTVSGKVYDSVCVSVWVSFTFIIRALEQLIY